MSYGYKYAQKFSNNSKNFSEKGQQWVQEVMKSPYQLGFLNLKQDHSEDDLEEALVNNITRFLLELGQGFSYVGRQMELVMPDGSTFAPDFQLAAKMRPKCTRKSRMASGTTNIESRHQMPGNGHTKPHMNVRRANANQKKGKRKKYDMERSTRSIDANSTYT